MVNARATHAPIGKGMYTFSDIDELFGLKKGRSYRLLNGKYMRKDVGIYGSRGYTHVDFLTMIELRVIDALRKLGVKPKEIQKARTELIKQGIHHPFADSRLKTDGGCIIWDDSGVTLEVTSKQTVLKKIMDGLFKQIHFSDKGLAEKFYPLQDKKTVVVDPRFAFGSPSVAGTRIKTKIIHGYFESGWDNAKIASNFGISTAAVADAITYESRQSKVS